MFRKLFITSLLCLFFVGCAAMTPQQEKVKKEEKDPCEILIDEVALKSRKTMKTVKESCDGLLIEVNPMWSMDYDGTVHIRLYDTTTGKKIKDELRKLADPQ